MALSLRIKLSPVYIYLRNSQIKITVKSQSYPNHPNKNKFLKQNKQQQKKDKFKLNSSVFIQTFNLTDITQSNSLFKKLIPTLALVNKS